MADTSPRIVLVRHGRSALPGSGWVDHAGLARWREAYDLHGLRAGERAPDALRALAARAGLVVASDLPRAVESARLLGAPDAVEHTPLLRETDLAIPPIAVRLPTAAWGLVIGLAWLRALRRETAASDTPARRQAREAAAWLVARAAERGTVVACTHGAIRRYLADALTADGWRCDRGPRPWAHWSAWSFERP